MCKIKLKFRQQSSAKATATTTSTATSTAMSCRCSDKAIFKCISIGIETLRYYRLSIVLSGSNANG